MGAKRTPLPTLRGDRFELGRSAEALGLILPLRSNRDPVESERDPGLWALEGVLNPSLIGEDGKPKRVLLASNIPNVSIIGNGTEREISGDDIVTMLASARSNRLSIEYPHLDVAELGEPTALAPEESSSPQYTDRLRVSGGVSIAFAHGAYREHFGAVASAIKSGLKPPDLSGVVPFAPEIGAARAA